MNQCFLVWLHIVLQVAICDVGIVSGSSEAQACTSQDGAFYEHEQCSTISLLQAVAKAKRSMSAKVKPSHDEMSGGAQDKRAWDRDTASEIQQFRKQEDRAFTKNHALRHMFPSEESTSDEVEKFFIAFGDTSTADLMQMYNVDGRILLGMDAEDLNSYGLSERDAQTILERIETVRSQVTMKESIARMSQSREVFAGVSALHDIVGPDGVLMITLDRKSDRFNRAAHVLKHIGVEPVKVSAVDVMKASAEELGRGCARENDAGVQAMCQGPISPRTGFGCVWPSEQAVAASHRKALEWAKKRDRDWTAIFEDDAVPAPVDNWNAIFQEAWKQLPSWVKFVRLGWCQIGVMDSPAPVIGVPYSNTTSALLITKETWGTMEYDPGGCTTAYMVHRDILDELIGLFPCCGPVDSCFKWDYFKAYNPTTQRERGLDIMMSMDTRNKPLVDDSVEQHGMILQDRVALDSSQEIPWATLAVVP